MKRQLEESYVKRDSEEVFNEYDTDKNKYLSFKETMEFAEVSEGTFLLISWFDKIHTLADKSSKDYKRELHRFTLTDQNKDRYLSLQEFEAYLHPQYFPHTREIYAQHNFDLFDDNE